MSKPLKEEDRKLIEDFAKDILKFSIETAEFFFDIIEKVGDEGFLEQYDTLRTYYGGLVDSRNKVNFYDGQIRIVDPNGREVHKFKPSEYLEYIAEKSVAWSYTKMPYLKKIGWVGLEDGLRSGVYRVGPLGRLNVADGFTTDRAQEFYERFKEMFGKPAHNTMAYHVARVTEMVYASERLLEIAQDDSIVTDDIINLEGEFRGEGVGSVEAPRGLLIHHYRANEEGVATMVNLIIPTTCLLYTSPSPRDRG